MKASKQREIIQTAASHPDRKLWEQRPRETAKAYDAFLIYRESFPDRNLSECARIIGKSHMLLRRWKQEYDWDIRAAAWDEMLAKKRDDAAIAEAQRMGERHAQLGMKMQDIGRSRLDQFSSSPELQASLTAQDTIRLVKEGTEIERAARGEDPDKGKQGNIIFNINLGGTGNGGLPKWAPKVLQVVEGEVVREDTDGKIAERNAGS